MQTNKNEYLLITNSGFQKFLLISKFIKTNYFGSDETKSNGQDSSSINLI